MALFFDDMLLDEIRHRNDIVELISMHTDLKPSGNKFLGLCPFHKEKTPSFFVNRDEQLYYCFGCHEGGNIINFVEKINNLDFIEAVRYLADRAGIPLPEENGEISKEHQLKKDLYEINKCAAIYFHNNLPKSEAALNYIKGRGLDAQTVKNFGLGYAEDSYTGLYEHLKSNGFSDWLMQEAGLISKGKGLYDFFRDRIIYPIIDLRGNVVAFSGRLLYNGKPKYINTKETEVFKKRLTLYGMNLAKNSKSGKILLAEGQMDVIALHRYGFDNAVASLGTAFGEDHAKLIKRYVNKVITCFDNDTAGQSATHKAAAYLMAEGVSVSVAILPEGMDPDEIIKEAGREAFESILKKAPSYMEFLLESEKKKHDMSTMDGKVSYARQATEHLSLLRDNLERELYIKRIAAEVGLSEQLIVSEYEKTVLKNKKIEDKKQETKEIIKRKKETNEDKIRNALEVCEGELLNIMIANISWFKRLSPMIKENFFSFPIYNKVMGLMVSLKEEKGTFDINMVIDRLEEKEKGRVISLKMKSLNYEITEPVVADLIKRIGQLKKQASLSKATSLEELNNQLKQMKGEG